MRALQQNCRSTKFEAPSEMLAFFPLAEKSLDFDRQVTKREPALVEVERKFAGCNQFSIVDSA